MFKKRSLQVKMVKNAEAFSQTDESFEKAAAIFGSCIETAVEKAGAAVILYVVADTVRQVVIARSTN